MQSENMLTSENKNIINDAIKTERRHNLEKARNVLFIVFVETCTLSEKDAKIGSIYAIKPGIVVVNTDKTNNN